MTIISLIIATYNAERYLKECLESIVPQCDKQIEIIIIDGGSSDTTVDIIKSFDQYISYWISEPDKGIYDAWNKGINKANGAWIMFLGADDKLVKGAISLYRNVIAKIQPDVEYISAKVQMIDLNNKPLRLKGGAFQWPLFLKMMTVAHPGSLHSKKYFEKYGYFNTEIRIVGDYELILRAGSSLKSEFVDSITVLMRIGGVSDTGAALLEHYKVVTMIGKYPKLPALYNLIISYIKHLIRCTINRIRR